MKTESYTPATLIVGPLVSRQGLTIQTGLTLSSLPASTSAGITGMHYHAWPSYKVIKGDI